MAKFLDLTGMQSLVSKVKALINSKISSAYKAKGSSAFASIPSPSADKEGFVYNITDSFTTTADFVEGTGKTYPAGTNIVVINNGTEQSPSYKWDVLASIVDISGKEDTANRVTSISSSSTDTTYPTAKAVYTYAPPKSHASSATTYGQATTSSYGHVKIVDNVSTTTVNGNALSANQGKLLQDQINAFPIKNLTADLNLVDGSTCSLATGTYYNLNGHYLKMNGTTVSGVSSRGIIFVYSESNIFIVWCYYNNYFAENLFSKCTYSSSTNKWTYKKYDLDTYELSSSDMMYKIPTTYAVKDAINNAISNLSPVRQITTFHVNGNWTSTSGTGFERLPLTVKTHSGDAFSLDANNNICINSKYRTEEASSLWTLVQVSGQVKASCYNNDYPLECQLVVMQNNANNEPTWWGATSFSVRGDQNITSGTLTIAPTLIAIASNGGASFSFGIYRENSGSSRRIEVSGPEDESYITIELIRAYD